MVVSLIIFLIIGVSVLGIARYVKRNSYKCRDCNVILISIDTLRADHLGCYGYRRNTTPTLDAFSKDSVLFSTAIAQAPSTELSHASIFTSLWPSRHGAYFSLKKPLPAKCTTMAEILQAYGYKTASFCGGGQIAAELGFAQGFDKYDVVSGKHFSDTVESGIEWVKNNNENKFFLFLHSYETHHPYVPARQYLDIFVRDFTGRLPFYDVDLPLSEVIERSLFDNIAPTEDARKKILDTSIVRTKDVVRVPVELLREINNHSIVMNEKDRQFIISAYDAEIRSMDNGLYLLMKFLKDSGVYDRTLIIFVSDHGEEFGEHVKFGWHAHSLYDELVKIPLVIKFPGSLYASAVVREQVRSIDILPTILDTLDIESDLNFDGTSLIKLLNGNSSRYFAISELDVQKISDPVIIRTRKWKYDGSQLFDLEKDPLEQVDVSEEYEEVVQSLHNCIENILIEGKTFQEDCETVSMLEETMDQLKSLGYTQ